MTPAHRNERLARAHYEQTHPRVTRMLVELLAAGCEVLRSHGLQDDTLGLGFEQFVCAEALARDIGEPTFLRALAAFEAVQRGRAVAGPAASEPASIDDARERQGASGTVSAISNEMRRPASLRRLTRTRWMLQTLTALWLSGDRALDSGPIADAAHLRVHFRAYLYAAGACRGLRVADLARHLGG